MTETIDFINSILFWIFLFVLLWQGYYLVFGKGIPNISTAPAIRDAIIAKIRKMRLESPVIYDLGCANGQFTRQLARALPDATITGIEISPLEYYQAVFLKWIYRPKNLHYLKQDFYSVDLGDADIIYLFLVGRDMASIRQKLETDLKSGTIIISNKFKIGGDWVPIETVTVKTLAPAQKTFYVYRV